MTLLTPVRHSATVAPSSLVARRVPTLSSRHRFSEHAPDRFAAVGGGVL